MPRVRKFGPHLTAGAVKLRCYLDEHEISVPRFCEERGLQRLQVQRMLIGKGPRVSLKFAVQVARATNDAVPILSWIEPAREASPETAAVKDRKRKKETDK